MKERNAGSRKTLPVFFAMEENQEYHKILQSMYGLRRFGIKLGLSVTRNILKNLGNPEKKFRSIHVAGTNGKGSVASSLAAILGKAGWKVGLYTSPHLVTFNERIRINDEMISDRSVARAYKAVLQAHRSSREPTFFEFTTAMAFYEFARKNIDWAVIETGMGGRLDATNVLRPALSIITNISVEHREYLGNTIAQVAFEKAGIIKPRRPVITGIRQKKAFDVIARASSEKSSPCFQLGKDFRVRKNRKGTFSYFGIDTILRDMKTGLAGNFQIDNAAVTLAACEILNRQKIDIPTDAIRQGLQAQRWPGRLEIVRTAPIVLLDGAHNLVAARNLAKFLGAQYKPESITLVVGILDDKPATAMLRAMVPQCSKVVATCPEIGRGIPAAAIAAAARPWANDIVVIPKVSDALQYAIENARENDVICVAGSLYVVGEAKAALASTTAFPV